MEDAEEDSHIDDDDWEDMEIEDDMENIIDIYSFFAYKKGQNSFYSTGQVYWKQKFNFFEDDLGGDISSDASPAFLSDHEFQHKYRMQIASFHKLVSLIQDPPSLPSSTGCTLKRMKTISTRTPTNGVSVLFRNRRKQHI